MKRLLVTGLGALLVVLGLLAFNYTTESKAPFHREWAEEKGLPVPSETVFNAGAASVALGTLVLVLGTLTGGRKPRG